MRIDDILNGIYEQEEGYSCSEEDIKSFNDIRDKNFGQLPETFFDQRSNRWISERKKFRKDFNGCKGRAKNIFGNRNTTPEDTSGFMTQINDGISRYDELKCHLLYKWFNTKNMAVLDPFAGGATRGIIANMNGAEYTGIDIRQEQIEANYSQYNEDSCRWLCDDSRNINKILEGQKFGHCQTSPPFPFVEHYSTLPEDLSNLKPNLDEFKKAYRSIFEQVYDRLVAGSSCVVDIGDGRASNRYYHLFPEWQALMMQEIGFKCINKIASITQPYGVRSSKLMQLFEGYQERDDRILFNTLCMVYVYIK